MRVQRRRVICVPLDKVLPKNRLPFWITIQSPQDDNGSLNKKITHILIVNGSGEFRKIQTQRKSSSKKQALFKFRQIPKTKAKRRE
ncbi:unnamed protein product [Tenebrio molitor]|nr:unnamed protein product [Tenebrio molitor]